MFDQINPRSLEFFNSLSSDSGWFSKGPKRPSAQFLPQCVVAGRGGETKNIIVDLLLASTEFTWGASPPLTLSSSFHYHPLSPLGLEVTHLFSKL